MPEDPTNHPMTSADWMKYYEKLFEEKGPVKSSPLSLRERDSPSSPDGSKDSYKIEVK